MVDPAFVEVPLAAMLPGQRHAWLTSLVMPRPIALVSTIDASGVENLAPFSFFALGGSNPPSLAFCPTGGGGGAPKDTLRNLRLGAFDVLVGINLLREGLDIPEVSLVAILDADKEGFLRAERSLIQTIGRAARNLNGRAILYADHITESMRRAMNETERRRHKQLAFNEANGITPRGVVKRIRDLIDGVYSDKSGDDVRKLDAQALAIEAMSEKDIAREIKRLEKEMLEHAKNLEFEKAARVRDQLATLKAQAFGAPGADSVLAAG